MSQVEYTTVEVCRLARATFRQVDYWCRRGILQPRHAVSGHTALSSTRGGSGTRRLFCERDTLKAVALAQMLRDGMTFEVASQLIRSGQWAEVTPQPLPTLSDATATAAPATGEAS